MSDWGHPGLPPHLMPGVMWAFAAFVWFYGLMTPGPAKWMLMAFGSVVMFAADVAGRSGR